MKAKLVSKACFYADYIRNRYTSAKLKKKKQSAHLNIGLSQAYKVVNEYTAKITVDYLSFADHKRISL